MKTKFYPLLITLTFLAGSVALQAQTVCNNEVIRFRETFGNVPLSEAFDDGVTGFKFMSGTQLENGEYTVSESSQARSEWHNSTDHTADLNGQMMIINPGFSDADIYSDSVNNLTTAGNYAVSLYVMNVTKPGTCISGTFLPRLQIQIEYMNGVTAYQHLFNYTSDPIPAQANPVWVKVITGFTLPPGVQHIRYRIVNQSIGDCGNSVAIDDITFSQCSSLSTLPVKGLKINNIEIAANGTKIFLSTESESQTDRMITQKSTDGINWTSINTLPAAGNSERHISYASFDNNPSAKVTYYRIRQTDLKGGESFSAVIKYNTANLNSNSLHVYPTPFTSQLQLNFTSKKNESFTATLFSADGLALQRIPVMARKGNNLVELNTAQLKQGTYLVTLVNNDGSIRLTQKTVK